MHRWVSMVGAVCLVSVIFHPREAPAQTIEDLKQRIQELERSTREQVEALRRLIEQREAERAQTQRSQEERERAYQVLKGEVERQSASRSKSRRSASERRWAAPGTCRSAGRAQAKQ